MWSQGDTSLKVRKKHWENISKKYKCSDERAMAAVPKYKKLFSLFRSNVETGVNLEDQVKFNYIIFHKNIFFPFRFTTFLWFSERMDVSFAWAKLSDSFPDLPHVKETNFHPPTAVIRINPQGVKNPQKTCQIVKKYLSSCPRPLAAVRRSCQPPLAAVTRRPSSCSWSRRSSCPVTSPPSPSSLNRWRSVRMEKWGGERNKTYKYFRLRVYGEVS